MEEYYKMECLSRSEKIYALLEWKKPVAVIIFLGAFYWTEIPKSLALNGSRILTGNDIIPVPEGNLPEIRFGVKEPIHQQENSRTSALALQGLKQDVTVAGTVVDQNGEPIPGATVSVPGTGIGTATDLESKYSLTVPDGATLVFSFIGFLSQSIEVGDQSIINISLTEEVASLDEVVVVGYGTQKEVTLPGR